jgi:hypothetical protein
MPIYSGYFGGFISSGERPRLVRKRTADRRAGFALANFSAAFAEGQRQ